MKVISSKNYVLAATVICALTMSLVDGVIMPPYAVKSAVKVVLFLLIPMLYYLTDRNGRMQLSGLFIPGKKELFLALGMGIGLYGLILGGYWLLTLVYDISDTVLQLTANAGVSGENFLAVSLYISLINSFLEEFFFRGFSFLTLKRHFGRRFSYGFSAAVFALYHYGMISAGNLLLRAGALLVLFVGGCLFNWLNERRGNIITSWLVHMFANFAINTVGFIIFGII